MWIFSFDKPFSVFACSVEAILIESAKKLAAKNTQFAVMPPNVIVFDILIELTNLTNDRNGDPKNRQDSK